LADRPTALFAMSPEHVGGLFPPALMNRLEGLVDIDDSLILQSFEQPGAVQALRGAEVLITGWGCPALERDVLDAAPRLRAALHAAGSIRSLVTDSCWERGLLVSSAVEANALPVAEYTLAAILLAGKDVLTLRERYRATQRRPDPAELLTIGNHNRRVGVIGASRVGRWLLELLRPFDFAVTLADPYVDAAEAARLGATLLPLDELLSTSDIVTLHAPDIAQTYRMLDRRRLALIPDGATLVNTSRGALVDPEALTDELVSGRLSAVLDVTEPEPLPPGSPLFTLPNVFLTPHLAGSLGTELERLGRTVVDELERLVNGTPLQHQVQHADLSRVA
jgi:phosphoglycerate dehydrogenase-like enzyme